MLSYDKMKVYLAGGLGITVAELERSCRPARESDLGGILSLRREVKGGEVRDDEKYLRWRFFDNPRKTGGEVPYLVFVVKGAIVGGLGLESIDILEGGAVHPAVRCFDIMARPDYEGRGIGAFLNMAALGRFATALVMNTNRKSTNLVGKLYHRMEDLQTCVLIAGTRAIISKRLGLGPLGPAAAVLPDALLGIGRRVRRRRVPRELAFRAIERFGDADDWTGPACADGRICARRDGQRLNWRFLDNPRRTYRALGVHDGGAMIGYVVCGLGPAREDGAREGVIADWMCAASPAAGRPALLALLFQEASRRMIAEGAEVVRCLTSDRESRAALAKNGFFVRRREACTFFVQSSDPELKKILTAPGRWFVNGFDNDAD